MKEFLQSAAVIEQRHLLRRFFFDTDLLSAVLLALGFQVGQHLPSAVDHALGQPGHLGHVHAVALVGPAGHYLVQEDHLVALFGHRHAVVANAWQTGGQVGQFVVMGREEGLAAQPGVVVDMFDDRACDGQAIIGAGAPADLVQDHQRARSGLVQDGGGLDHLHHERGLARGQVVLQSDPGEDPVDQTDGRFRCRNEAADLGHEGDDGHLPDVSGLSGHVRPGQHHHPRSVV